MYNPYEIRYPGFRKKALTLSYDDGVVQDVRLIEIMNKYGIKGAFNLNGGVYEGVRLGTRHARLGREEALALYPDSGQEVALHSYTHPFLDRLPAGQAAWEIVKDREALEGLFGGIIRGFAYPMGTYNDSVVDALRQCGIAYARTTKATHGFDLPADWLRLETTCRNRDPKMLELGREFLALEPKYEPKLFYLWGHSYEFDEDHSWQEIENFCAMMGGREDIWYATNIEIYDYLTAFDCLQASIDGKMLRNPTAMTLFLETKQGNLILGAGETAAL